jgi:hypothetical protein
MRCILGAKHGVLKISTENYRARIPALCNAATTLFIVLSIAMGLASCASSFLGDPGVFRDLTIARGRFNRATIPIPANTPVTLEIGLVGMIGASVSSPELGIKSTTVPPNAVQTSKVHNPGPGYFKIVKIPVKPLAVGKYDLVCACGGHREVATLDVQ